MTQNASFVAMNIICYDQYVIYKMTLIENYSLSDIKIVQYKMS